MVYQREITIKYCGKSQDKTKISRSLTNGILDLLKEKYRIYPSNVCTDYREFTTTYTFRENGKGEASKLPKKSKLEEIFSGLKNIEIVGIKEK